MDCRRGWIEIALRRLGLFASAAACAIAVGTACYAQEWIDGPIDKAVRTDFEAKEPRQENLYLLPLEVGPARRVDFTGSARYETPERVGAVTEIARASANMAEPSKDAAPKPPEAKRQ